MKNKIFIVALISEGVKLYYVRQQSKLTHEEGMVLNEPVGIFSPDLLDARKYIDKAQAEWTASYFEGAQVEVIASAERLK